MQQKKVAVRIGCLVLSAVLGGCATSTKDARDPYESWNRDVQSFNDKLDDYAMKPVAKAYRWATPDFVDQGISNFFSNINDIGVTINDLLQWKVEQGGTDGLRFVLNTTAGVGGFIDVASIVGMPRHNEDFDQTLGVWGVPNGPYLVLPFFGPSSPRGIGGLMGDAAMNPISYVSCAPLTSGLFGINAIDMRADNLSNEKIATEAAIDRYAFFKSAYFQQRDYLVHDGNVQDSADLFENIEDLDRDNLAPVNPY